MRSSESARRLAGDYAIGGQRLARYPDRRGRAVARAGTRCSSYSPTSPAANGGRRRRRWRPAKTPTAMPPRSTCWRRWRNSLASAPIRKPSIEALEPLQPRLYSISSSPKVEPGRLSLTVDTVRYDIAGRTRLGVASTYLAERIAPGDPAPGLCAEGACLRPAGRSVRAGHHGRSRHRRRAVPRLPA